MAITARHISAYLNAALDHYELFNDTATAEQALALYEENKETQTSGLKNQVLDLEFEGDVERRDKYDIRDLNPGRRI